ncbi:hypothetical protein MO085_004553 [Escherichia coli]|nr:hypothetical protein [Escherichia coli]
MNNEVIVTARKLTDYEERLMFMPKFFGQYWLFVENHTYNWMRKLSPENKSRYLSSALDKIEAHYNGGEWDFYELSNSAYYHQLFDYASGHQEYAQFRAAID